MLNFKKTHLLRAVIILLALSLTFTACNTSNTASDSTTATAPTVKPTEASTEAPTAEPEENMYPEDLAIFSPLSENLSKIGASSNNDNYVFQKIEEITGTHVEWSHPATGSDYAMALNLMVTSGELTDIIVNTSWKNVTGGVAAWVEDGTLIELTDLMPEYMPNYMNQLDQRPGAINGLKIEEKLYFISEFATGSAWRGPMLRGDWLEALNLDYPTTVDELYDVLVAFRDADMNGNGQADEWAMSGLAFPSYSFAIGNLLWPFGVHYDFMQIDGTVTYGPLQPEFTDAMTYIAKLYEEGLIDPDYSTQDRNSLDGKFMNDLVGFEFGIQPSKMNNAMEGTGFKAEGTLNLSRNSGDPSYVFGGEYISYLNSWGEAAISSTCDEPEKALAWMDFFFSDEGILLSGYGIEGLSYEIVDGKPEYDFSGALNLRPDLDEDSVFDMFVLVNKYTIPIVQSKEAYYTTLHPYSAIAVEGWNNSADISRILPSLSLTTEESESINDILVDIGTYMSIEYDKLVTGQTGIDEIPSIQQTLVDMGINDIIEVYQTAYDRYLGK